MGQKPSVPMMNLKPFFLTTGIGSLPHRDPYLASQLIFDCFPESPYWPQLPLKDWREGMLLQYTEGMPGLVLDRERTYFRTPFQPSSEWERFYQSSSREHLDEVVIGREFASGLHAFLELLKGRRPLLVKGQVTGPITLGLGLCDEKRIPILYDPNLKEMLLEMIVRKATWQEKEFTRAAPQAETVIFFDEPVLTSYGSISMNLGKDEVVDCLNKVASALKGLSGIHICGATDWSLVTETTIDVLHFDAYQFFSNLLAYAPELKAFLTRGGMLGWGMVPAQEELLKKETLSSLVEKLRGAIGSLTEEGIPKDLVIQNSFISQSCGLASLSEGSAERALRLTRELSLTMREAFKSNLP